MGMRYVGSGLLVGKGMGIGGGFEFASVMNVFEAFTAKTVETDICVK